VNVAPGLLEAGKKRLRQRLKMEAFLFKTDRYLFACGAMDTLVGNLVFPLLEKKVLFAKGFESSPFERVGAHIPNPWFHFAFGMDRELHPMQRIQYSIFV
jgi:hypothetical protein